MEDPEEESKHAITDNLSQTLNELVEEEEQKVSIMPMMKKSNLPSDDGKETWRDFKGVNNIELFDCAEMPENNTPFDS